MEKVLTPEDKEWITKVLLTSYKSLSVGTTLDYSDKIMLDKLRQMLLEDGFTNETLEQVVLEYAQLSEEERLKEIEEKVEALISQIVPLLEGKEEISSKEYPELYYCIQELVAINPEVANQLIKEAYAKENIRYGTDCSGSLYGEECSYCFSKTLTYE